METPNNWELRRERYGPSGVSDPEAFARKISEARKREWADPEMRAKRIAARKRAWADPETRQRIIDGIRRAAAKRPKKPSKPPKPKLTVEERKRLYVVARNDLDNPRTALRVAENLGLQDVADLLGVARETVRNWENGKRGTGLPYRAYLTLLDGWERSVEERLDRVSA